MAARQVGCGVMVRVRRRHTQLACGSMLSKLHSLCVHMRDTRVPQAAQRVRAHARHTRGTQRTRASALAASSRDWRGVARTSRAAAPGRQLLRISLYRLVPLMSTTKPSTSSAWKDSQPTRTAYSQMKRVRHASIVARAAPLSDFVTARGAAGKAAGCVERAPAWHGRPHAAAQEHAQGPGTRRCVRAAPDRHACMHAESTPGTLDALPACAPAPRAMPRRLPWARAAPEMPKKLKNAMEKMEPTTAAIRAGSAATERSASAASSSGRPSGPATSDVSGSTSALSSRPHTPSRPTASSAGTCCATRVCVCRCARARRAGMPKCTAHAACLNARARAARAPCTSQGTFPRG